LLIRLPIALAHRSRVLSPFCRLLFHLLAAQLIASTDGALIALLIAATAALLARHPVALWAEVPELPLEIDSFKPYTNESALGRASAVLDTAFWSRLGAIPAL
jgi:hypothetical protein